MLSSLNLNLKKVMFTVSKQALLLALIVSSLQVHVCKMDVLTKCSNKFDCLIKEMLYMGKLKSSLNVQRDLIRAKVFN